MTPRNSVERMAAGGSSRPDLSLEREYQAGCTGRGDRASSAFRNSLPLRQ